MSKELDFDLAAAHRYFAVDCFNETWELINQPERSPEQDEQMLLRCLASLYHWTQRVDCTATNRSIGYWQAARVYALLGQIDNARRFGLLCLEASRQPEVEPVFMAWAFEALARAEASAGNTAQMEGYLDQARTLAEQVQEQDERAQLLNDLETIRIA
jgi:hypothetical protein